MCYIVVVFFVKLKNIGTFFFIPSHTYGYHFGCRCVCLSVRPSVFWFQDNNLSKCQWIFTRLDVSIDIVEIWFGIAYGQISSIFNKLSACDMSVSSFPDDNVSKSQWIFTKLDMCINMMEIFLGVANGQISSIFENYLPVTHLYFSFRTIT